MQNSQLRITHSTNIDKQLELEMRLQPARLQVYRMYQLQVRSTYVRITYIRKYNTSTPYRLCIYTTPYLPYCALRPPMTAG